MIRTLAFSLVALAGVAACKQSKAGGNDAAAEQTVAVQLTTAKPMPTPDRITLTGTVVADESSDVAADIAGKVVAVLVERGQEVKQGDPLVRLDTRNAALGAREARANLESARAQRQLAQDECKRAQALFDKGAITKSQYEREQTSCTAALQQVAAAEARTQMITKSISDGIVRAPFAGFIADRWVSPGEWIAPGMRLVTLIDVDPLKVELSVPEIAVPQIAMQQPVSIRAVAWPEKTFDAKVSLIGTEIGRMTRALPVEVELAEVADMPLRPGMFVEAKITVKTPDRLTVPKTAVVKRGQTHRLFVAVGGRLQERVVQLADAEPAPDTVAILKGLDAVEDKDAKIVVVAGPKTVDGAKYVEGKPSEAGPRSGGDRGAAEREQK
jgi:membrane fusion protein (multidrug efflux system)